MTLPVGSYGQPKYPIGSGYGWRIHPITKERTFHMGIDIPAPRGEYVRAAVDGTVSSSRLSPSYGNVIDIVSDYGHSYTYAHMDYRAVAKGDIVQMGEIIGTVGDTGNVTGPHLHFEIRDPVHGSVNPTDCYLDAIHELPYGITPEHVLQAAGLRPKMPTWAKWTIGIGSVVVIGGIIIGATRDKK